MGKRDIAEKRGLLGWLRSTRTVDEPKGAEGLGPQERQTQLAKTPTVERQLLKRFVDEGELAAGGMSSIRKVFDNNLLRHVAMKVLEPEFVAKDHGLVRFMEEAQITGQLDHPNIVPIHDLGVDDEGTNYFTMKLVRGHTLTELLIAGGDDIGSQEAIHRYLQIFLKVCDAVAFAHSRGVIHRDLKPDNIMVGDYGQVYVMDWGVALVKGASRVTDTDTQQVQLQRDTDVQMDQSGSVVGTLQYMAPEMAHGRVQDIDERSDVFLLGAILYQILTRVPPYFTTSTLGTLTLAQEAQWVPAQERVGDAARLPPGLCRIAAKAMSKEKGDRYQSVEALKASIEQFLRGGWRFPTRVFPPGTAIVREGEPGDRAFIIVSGECVVRHAVAGHTEEVGRLHPGDVFGEAAVLARRRRTATVEAVTEVTAMEVTRELLEEELGLEGWMGTFIKAIANRFVETDRQLRELKGLTLHDD